jgi:hypothetical protein
MQGRVPVVDQVPLDHSAMPLVTGEKHVEVEGQESFCVAWSPLGSDAEVHDVPPLVVTQLVE